MSYHNRQENEEKNQQYLNGFDYGTLYSRGLMDEPTDSSNLSKYFLDGFKQASGLSYFDIFGCDEDEDDSQCLGHESLSGPIGNVVYCDGSCRKRSRLENNTYYG